jgi:hypothetical protein
LTGRSNLYANKQQMYALWMVRRPVVADDESQAATNSAML